MLIGSNVGLLSLNLQKNLAKLSLSTKIDKREDENIYESIENSIASKSAKIKNFNDDIGFLQIADSALSSLSKQNNKLQKLSITKNSAVLSNEQKDVINSQMNDIKNAMSRIINETSFNGINVFNSKNISIDANDIDINNLDSIKNFQKTINHHKSDISSFINSAKSEINHLSTSIVSKNKSKSNLEIDFAKESINFNNKKVKLSATLIANSHKLKNNITSLLR